LFEQGGEVGQGRFHAAVEQGDERGEQDREDAPGERGGADGGEGVGMRDRRTAAWAQFGRAGAGTLLMRAGAGGRSLGGSLALGHG
jgi:hypothetical protein